MCFPIACGDGVQQERRRQSPYRHHKQQGKAGKGSRPGQGRPRHRDAARRGALLYENDLADVSDLAEEIAQKHGDWFDFGKQANYVNGRWLGIPWGAWAFVSVYRPDYFKAVGASIPTDWRDVPASLHDSIDKGMKLAHKLSWADNHVRLKKIFDEHVQVFDAIAAGDAEGAQNAMRHHIENARERILGTRDMAPPASG